MQKAITAVAILIATTLGAACSRSDEPAPASKPSTPVQPLPSAPGQLPPGFPQRGPVARLDGFMGLSFYPGSEDTRPASGATDPNTPSVRTTPDGVEKVVAFYKTRLSNTAQETRKGKTVVVEGRTPAGEVQILVEPTAKSTQITMRRK